MEVSLLKLSAATELMPRVSYNLVRQIDILAQQGTFDPSAVTSRHVARDTALLQSPVFQRPTGCVCAIFCYQSLADARDMCGDRVPAHGRILNDGANEKRRFYRIKYGNNLRVFCCTVSEFARTSLTASRNSFTISPKLSASSEVGINHAAEHDRCDEGGGVWLDLR